MTLARAKALLPHDPAQALALADALPHTPEQVLLCAAALRRCGDAAGALARLDALVPVPPAWGIAYERGMAHAMLGEAEAAADALTLAHARNPRSAVAAHALADQLVLAGRPLPDSLMAARAAALRADPAGADRHDPGWLRLLADAAPHDAAACALLHAALAIAPRFTAATFALAVRHEAAQRGAEALALAAPLAERHPRSSAVHALVAAAQLQMGRPDAALEACDAAIALAPREATLQRVRGHALRQLGRADAAVAAYRAALRLAPDRAGPWWDIAHLKSGRLDRADIAAMEALAARDLPDAERAPLHYALGQAHDDAGNHAAAMAHWHRANALRQPANPHDGAAHARLVDALIATVTPAFLAAHAGAAAAGELPRDSPRPVFIVGLPRAGSTLLEQMLASHPMVEGLGELPDLPQLAAGLALPTADSGALRDLGRAYRARIARRQQTARPLVVDKLPGNALHVGLIHLALPDAVVIEVRRHPMACGLSLYQQDFAEGQGFSHDLAEIGRHIRRHARLMAHWDAVLPGRVLRVAYETLVAGPEAQLRRVLDHCGLPFDPACLRFFENPRAVATASSEQVRRPLDPSAPDRWRAYAPWLESLAAALDDGHGAQDS